MSELDAVLDTLAKMEHLVLLYKELESIVALHDFTRDSVIPPEVQKMLDDVDEEFGVKEETVQEKIVKLEAEIKASVLQNGQSVTVGDYQAVYSRARVTWNTEALEGYAVSHPEILQLRKEGQPSVTIRKAGRKT